MYSGREFNGSSQNNEFKQPMPMSSRFSQNQKKDEMNESIKSNDNTHLADIPKNIKPTDKPAE